MNSNWVSASHRNTERQNCFKSSVVRTEVHSPATQQSWDWQERGPLSHPQGVGFLELLGLNYHLNIVFNVAFISQVLSFLFLEAVNICLRSFLRFKCVLGILFCRLGVPQILWVPCKLLLLIKKHKQSTFWQMGDLIRYLSKLGTKRDSPIP